MGCASRVTPGKPQSDSPDSSLPIANSPPGIHTMPSGAGLGAGVLFGMVGPKAELAAAAASAWPATGRGQNLATTTTPTTTTAPATNQRTRLVLGAVAAFCPPFCLFLCLLMGGSIHCPRPGLTWVARSEEHTSELQSL